MRLFCIWLIMVLHFFKAYELINEIVSPVYKVKVSNYLSTLVQKRTAYRGTQFGALNLEFEAKSRESFHLRKAFGC